MIKGMVMATDDGIYDYIVAGAGFARSAAVVLEDAI